MLLHLWCFLVSFSLFVWRCVHAPHWGHAVSPPLPQTVTSPADSTSEPTGGMRNIRRWISQSSPPVCMHLNEPSPIPELNRFWMIVGSRCHMTQRTVKDLSDVYVSTPLLFLFKKKEKKREKKIYKLQVAERNLFWSPSVSLFLIFSSKWKTTCSKLSKISLKLPVFLFI